MANLIDPAEAVAEAYTLVVALEDEAVRINGDTHKTPEGKAFAWDGAVKKFRAKLDPVIGQLEEVAEGLGKADDYARAHVIPPVNPVPDTADELAVGRVLARPNFDPEHDLAKVVKDHQGSNFLALFLVELEARKMITPGVLLQALVDGSENYRAWFNSYRVPVEKARVLVRRIVDGIRDVYDMRKAANRTVSTAWIDLGPAGLPDGFKVDREGGFKVPAAPKGAAK